MPYALMRGGWLALAALVVIMPLFALSGQVLLLISSAREACCLQYRHMDARPWRLLSPACHRAALTCCNPLPQLMVWAFDLMPANAPKTYPELGRAAAGRLGVQAVMLFSFLGKPWLWG